MNAQVQTVEQSLEGMSSEERVMFAEQLLIKAGFPSLLPSHRHVELALPAAELEALAAVGLRRTSRTRERAEAARVRYAVTFLDLFKDADTPAALATKLDLDASRIRQRIREGSLLAVELNGEKRVPRFQFEGAVEVPGLTKVLQATQGRMTPLAFAMWFLTPTQDLQTDDGATAVSPRDWLLRTGDAEPVLSLVDEG
jgi:hypothetical protein